MAQPSLLILTPGTQGTFLFCPLVAPLFSPWGPGGPWQPSFLAGEVQVVPPALALTGPGQLTGGEIVQERHDQPLPQEELHQLGGHVLPALP